MSHPLIDLAPHEKRYFSQHAEDGITLELVRLLRQPAFGVGLYVEIGTEDGRECNTRVLREHLGWTGLMLDGSYDNPSIGLHKEFLTRENVLDTLSRYRVPYEFQLLSLDIDYNDFYILSEILKVYQPGIIICEYNASHLPTEDRIVQYSPLASWDVTNYFGASLLSFHRLCSKFGYVLVYTETMGVNAFFVRADLLRGTGLVFKDQDCVEKLYHPPRYGPGPRGGHGADPHNRPYIESAEVLSA